MKVSSNDRYTLKQLLADFPALYPLPKSYVGKYITMENARKLFNGSFVWQDPEAGNNYEILDGCLISCEGLVQLRSMTSYQETHPYWIFTKLEYEMNTFPVDMYHLEK